MDYERDQRDAEVARLRPAHVPFRAIAERLNMSLGAVQKALRRYQKREQEISPELADLDAVAARYGLAGINDTSHAETVAVLATLAADPTNELELYRVRHLPRLPDNDDWSHQADTPCRRGIQALHR